jgi:3-oxoacyl-[acyl-carrier protein] reductase
MLAGQVALVTGASRGIGKCIARRLGDEGADLVLLDLDKAGLEKTRTELQGIFAGRKVREFACNVAEHQAVAEVVDRAIKDLGKIDICVNNAGITRDNLILRMSEAEWDSVLAVNLKGIFNVSKAVARHMLKARAGRIVNISSIVGLIGNAGQTNYSASKAGALGLTFSLARELASRGVTVNAVAPGFIDTDMTQALGDEARQRLLSQIPLRRLGKPEDVAEAVVFLCGPSAGYITGEVIRVDGGMAIG